MFTIKKYSEAGGETALKNLKNMLELAYDRKKVMDNINEAANNEKRKQLRDHGIVLEEKDIAGQFLEATRHTPMEAQKNLKKKGNIRQYRNDTRHKLNNQ